MAGSKSNYLAKKFMDELFGATAYSAPATLYFALFTDSNTSAQRDAGTVTEVSGNAYARVGVTNNTTNFPNASGTTTATKQNGTAITFPTPTGSWGTVTAFGIYDASSGGNLLFWGDLTSSQTVNTGNTVTFSANALTITED